MPATLELVLIFLSAKGDGNGCDHDRFAERRQDVSAASACGMLVPKSVVIHADTSNPREGSSP